MPIAEEQGNGEAVPRDRDAFFRSLDPHVARAQGLASARLLSRQDQDAEALSKVPSWVTSEGHDVGGSVPPWEGGRGGEGVGGRAATNGFVGRRRELAMVHAPADLEERRQREPATTREMPQQRSGAVRGFEREEGNGYGSMGLDKVQDWLFSSVNSGNKVVVDMTGLSACRSVCLTSHNQSVCLFVCLSVGLHLSVCLLVRA